MRRRGSRFSSSITLSLLYCLFLITPGFSTPDPRDSIIIESKTVFATDPPSPVTVRVYITNRDTLASYAVALVERSVGGGAYLVLAQPRSYGNAVRPLDSTLQFFKILADNRYNDSPPDTLAVGGFSDIRDPATWQPPNPSRKVFLELKFDSTRGEGTVEIDSALIQHPNGAYVNSGFDRLRPQGGTRNVPVHFAKGRIVIRPALSFDLSGDSLLTLKDVVLAMDCVFSRKGDCNGLSTPDDFVALLNALFSTNITIPVEGPEKSRKRAKPEEK